MNKLAMVVTVAVAALLMLATPSVLAQAPAPGGFADRIDICHATGSAAVPYELLTVGGSDITAHQAHPGDLIPAPPGGCPSAAAAAGANVVTTFVLYAEPPGSGGTATATTIAVNACSGAASGVLLGGVSSGSASVVSVPASSIEKTANGVIIRAPDGSTLTCAIAATAGNAPAGGPTTTGVAPESSAPQPRVQPVRLPATGTGSLPSDRDGQSIALAMCLAGMCALLSGGAAIALRRSR
jgi:hypothetical protein